MVLISATGRRLRDVGVIAGKRFASGAPKQACTLEPDQAAGCGSTKDIRMKHNLTWTGALALAACIIGQVEALAQTDGVIFISTRKPQDTQWGTEYQTDPKGPGQVSPGDIAMANLLADHGYSCRVLLDVLLGPIGGIADSLWIVTNDYPHMANFMPKLVIISGSSAGADVPPTLDRNVPIMMGEHVTISDRANQGSIFMYRNGSDSTDPNSGSNPPASQYMKIINTNHPIVQGIPLDSQGRVKIFRDPYPEENLHVAPDGKKNYEYRWCTQRVTNAAPGTVVLGVLDGEEFRSCFAVVDIGGELSNGVIASNRMVHFFVNENGSGGSRRAFLALTEWGRLLFLRAAQWAMGETLQPYQPLRIKDVTNAGEGRISVSWEGSAKKNYRLLASTDLSNPSGWQLVSSDIPGADGLITRTLDISAGPQAAFLRVQTLP